jgi:dTDP-L-rhamnose 4-epimerase
MTGRTHKRILVTGAAGFVGSHTVDLLVDRGYEVTALDSLDPQVHGADAAPKNIAKHVQSQAIRFIRGDVRDRALMSKLVAETDAILHLAAAVGVGQSMYMPHHYADVNVGGTALLMDILANQKHGVRRIVVASSMSLYGEGQYSCQKCGPVFPNDRSAQRLKEHRWEHTCPNCGATVTAVPTPESKPLYSTSVYAISKKVQEEMLVVFGKAYNLPVIALRYFNIYGSRQSLNNPYTGVAAIFLSRLLNRSVPVVFEDGGQSRDFVHVRDIARANVLALESDRPGQDIYNVGTGKPTTINEVAEILGRGLGTPVAPAVENKFRAGDVRHCFSDSSKIGRELGFRAEMDREEGFRQLIEFSRNEKPSDQFEASLAELRARNLVT